MYWRKRGKEAASETMDPRLTWGDGELKFKVITKAKERERDFGFCNLCVRFSTERLLENSFLHINKIVCIVKSK